MSKSLLKWIKQNSTQAQLARELKCSEATISLILKGDRSPSPKLARLISRKTGLSLETVLFREAAE